MNSNSSSFKWSLFFLMMVSSSVIVSAHSEMRCAKYDIATGACAAPIRNSGVAFLQEAYTFNGGAICQSPMSNPISASYANGAGCPDYANCPAPMGTFTPGETFTVMWWARNHAVADQSPATVFLYVSPLENQNQGADVSQAVMEQGYICQGPYMNCKGLNGDQVPCTLTCKMPTSLAKGIYTMWWKWIWQNGVTYTTCADIQVSVGGTPSPSPSPPPAAISTGKAPVTTAAKPVNPPTVITTGRATKVTTGRVQPVTTGKKTSASVTSTSTSTGSAAVTSTSSSTPSGQRCNYSEMRCTSSNTYQSCGYSQDGLNEWTASQACANGLVCSASPPYIYCTRA